MWNLDRLQDPYGFGPRMHLHPLKMKASDYMRTRVYHGLIDDAYGPEMIPLIGADRVLWGSDFPHIRSIGLEAPGACPQAAWCPATEEQAKVVGGSAARCSISHRVWPVG